MTSSVRENFELIIFFFLLPLTTQFLSLIYCEFKPYGNYDYYLSTIVLILNLIFMICLHVYLTRRKCVIAILFNIAYVSPFIIVYSGGSYFPLMFIFFADGIPLIAYVSYRITKHYYNKRELGMTDSDLFIQL